MPRKTFRTFYCIVISSFREDLPLWRIRVNKGQWLTLMVRIGWIGGVEGIIRDSANLAAQSRCLYWLIAQRIELIARPANGFIYVVSASKLCPYGSQSKSILYSSKDERYDISDRRSRTQGKHSCAILAFHASKPILSKWPSRFTHLCSSFCLENNPNEASLKKWESFHLFSKLILDRNADPASHNKSGGVLIVSKSTASRASNTDP